MLTSRQLREFRSHSTSFGHKWKESREAFILSAVLVALLQIENLLLSKPSSRNGHDARQYSSCPYVSRNILVAWWRERPHYVHRHIGPNLLNADVLLVWLDLLLSSKVSTWARCLLERTSKPALWFFPVLHCKEHDRNTVITVYNADLANYSVLGRRIQKRRRAILEDLSCSLVGNSVCDWDGPLCIRGCTRCLDSGSYWSRHDDDKRALRRLNLQLRNHSGMAQLGIVLAAFAIW